jgi:hypothetical protein
MMFVDDSNIFMWAPTYQLLALKLRDYYTDCYDWCLRVGLTIKPEKTEVLFFSCLWPNLTLHSPHPSMIYLPDWGSNTYYMTTATDHIQYLGLHFDHKLSWNKHISVVAMRTKGMLKALQLLSNSVCGLNHGSWHLAYNAICIPMLMYGSPIWYRDQKKHIKSLQVVQNLAI